MKKIIITTSFFLLSALGACAMNFDEAKKQEKPVVVMFHVHGCGACRQIEPLFDKIAEKNSEKFVFVKEDVDASNLAKSLNFKFVPAFFIVEPKTLQAKRIEDDCAWDKKCFEKTLKEYKK